MFDINARNTDAFNTSLREIAEYVARNVTNGGEFIQVLDPEQLGFDPNVEPSPPADVTNLVEVEKWKMKLRRWESVRTKREEATRQAFAVVIGQCSRTLRDRMETHSEWSGIKADLKIVELAKLIRKAMYSGPATKHTTLSFIEAEQDLIKFKQAQNLSNARYLEIFKSKVEVYEHLGGEPGTSQTRIDNQLIKMNISNPAAASQSDQLDAKKAVREEYLSNLFIQNADGDRYGDLNRRLRIDQALGVARYPETLVDAYAVLQAVEETLPTQSHPTPTDEAGMAFTTTGSDGQGGRGGGGGGRGGGGKGGRGGRNNRGGRGGRGPGGRGRGGRRDTDNEREEDQNNHAEQANAAEEHDDDGFFEPESDSDNANNSSDLKQYSLCICNAQRHHTSDLDRVLTIDSASSCDIISQPSLVHNVHTAERPLIVNTIMGKGRITDRAYLGDYPPPVWYYPSGGVNVLSLDNVQHFYRCTMDTEKENSINVHLEDGGILKFTPTGKGLYTYRLGPGETIENVWSKMAHSTNLAEDFSMSIDTVAQRAKNYTKRDYERAIRARKLENIIMRPGTRKFIDTCLRHLHNCPVTQGDARAANDIFGRNLGSIKGKTVRRANPHVEAGTDPVPRRILRLHGRVILCIDIMFVNAIPFFITTSRNLRFGTVASIPNRRKSTIRDQLMSVIRTYHHRGFEIVTILGDNEFEPLRPLFPQLQTCAANEHIPDVERYIRTIKDSTRSTYRMLPFTRVPRLVIVHLVKNAVLWFNAFPPADGISTDHSPRYLLTGRELSYARHAQLEFGSYVQTHEEHSNDMRQRTLGAICLGPTGNAQGGHWFLNLSSGARIVRYNWDVMPMPAAVITRVNAIGARQRMPTKITYSDRYGREIEDTLDDLEYESEDEDDSTYASADDTASSTTHSDSDDDDASIDDDDDSADDDDGHDPRLPDGDSLSTPAELVPADDELPVGEPDIASQADERDLPDPPARPPPRTTGVRTRSAARRSTIHQRPEIAGVEERHITTTRVPPEPTGVPPATTGVPVPPRTTGVPPPATLQPTRPTIGDRVIPGSVETPDLATFPAPMPFDDEETIEFVPMTEQEKFDAAQEEGRTAAQRNHPQPFPRRSRRLQRHEPNHLACQGNIYNILADSDGHGINAFSYLLAVVERMDPDEVFSTMMQPSIDGMMSMLTEQMSAKKGLKHFGQRGADAIKKELEQLVYRKVMHGKKPSELTREQRRAALRYLMFLKEKRSGKVKGRGCADGRKQRIYKTKDETSSPTIHIESLMLLCIIDAIEGRYVVTLDIPGAFMQADIDEIIHVKLVGEIAELLVRVEPSYENFIAIEKGQKVIYTELDKALYGTLQAGLLFWTKLSKFLVENLNFEKNPYDFCVANKTVNGQQVTVGWHVDDLKISHVDPDVVEDLVSVLQNEFGKEAPLTVTRGEVHEYLVMTIDYTVDGKVQIYMYDYIDRMIADAPADLMKGPCSTPAANHLFETNDNAEKLDPATAIIYHHLTAQLLYLAKRTRPDLLTAVSFLCTRVQQPDVDDWKKLGRCLRFARDTRDDRLTLSARGTNRIFWWIDASFAVHPNMRSHTGATMTLGEGTPFAISSKQKINTRSSTEAEVVGVNDAMYLVLWVRHFLEAQGYDITDNIVYQDNMSSILLEKNGRRSCSKNTRHMEIRYFFVTDNISRGKLSVEYCPTDDMLADYYTKPVQGSKCRKFRQRILNLPFDPNVSPQECVEATTETSASMSRSRVSRNPVRSARPAPRAEHITSGNNRQVTIDRTNAMWPRLSSNRKYTDANSNTSSSISAVAKTMGKRSYLETLLRGLPN